MQCFVDLIKEVTLYSFLLGLKALSKEQREATEGF